MWDDFSLWFWQSGFVQEMNLVNQPSPNSCLSLKTYWLSKPPSLFLVVPGSWGHAKTHQRPKGEGCCQHLHGSELETRPLDGSWESMRLGPFQGETGKWMFLLFHLCWAQVHSSAGVLLSPFKNYFFVCYGPVGHMDTSLVGFQS